MCHVLFYCSVKYGNAVCDLIIYVVLWMYFSHHVFVFLLYYENVILAFHPVFFSWYTYMDLHTCLSILQWIKNSDFKEPIQLSTAGKITAILMM